jgi:hypothetical protein
MKILAIVLLTILAAPGWTQQIKLPSSFGRLAEVAVEKVDITLDASLLRFAAGFLSSREPEEAQARELISDIRGLTVKSFKFDRPGEYSDADLEAIRSQVRGPEWARMVGVAGRTERLELYARREGDRVAGVVILAAQPKELTLVDIAGTIDLNRLSELGGRFGIPRIEVERKAKPGKD